MKANLSASAMTYSDHASSALSWVFEPKEPKSPLFGNAAAADYLGVEPQTLEVWRCTKRYEIPYIKVGRLVKYRQRDLDDWLNSRTVGQEGGDSHE